MDYLKGKVVVVLVIDELSGLLPKIRSLVDEGYSVFEVTLRTPCALAALKEIRAAFPDLKLGAGTVLTEEQLRLAIEAGADFGVAPGYNASITSKAKELNFDFIPGVSTASEIEVAMAAGYSLLKLFPAEAVGGIKLIKALSGPYTDVTFMPTGGVSEANYQAYLDLESVCCVGGSWMTK